MKKKFGSGISKYPGSATQTVIGGDKLYLYMFSNQRYADYRDAQTAKDAALVKTNEKLLSHEQTILRHEATIARLTQQRVHTFVRQVPGFAMLLAAILVALNVNSWKLVPSNKSIKKNCFDKVSLTMCVKS